MPNTSKVLRKHLFHPVSPTTIVDELLILMPTPSHPRCFCQDHQWSLLGPRITRLLPPWNAVFTWPHTLTLPTCLLLGWSPFSCWILPIFLPFKYWHALSSVFSVFFTPRGISSGSMASFLISTLATPNSHPINSVVSDFSSRFQNCISNCLPDALTSLS